MKNVYICLFLMKHTATTRADDEAAVSVVNEFLQPDMQNWIILYNYRIPTAPQHTHTRRE